MTEPLITRRRALSIMAAAMTVATSPVQGAPVPVHEWEGIALGADARLMLLGGTQRAAEEAVSLCLDEVERLERIFSLHQDDAHIVRLNRSSRLDHPPTDFLHLLHHCSWLNTITEGLFDPTVQRLWQGAAAWYYLHPEREMPAAMSTSLRSSIGFGRIQLVEDAIRLGPDTELTLNGIAQGYITDRAANILRQRGWQNVLIDLGETRAIGGRENGDAFEIDVRESGLRVRLQDRALATSAPDALLFSPDRQHSHILHPLDGKASSPWSSVTVEHDQATIADGLSTALVLADADTIERIVARVKGARVWATRRDGSILSFT